MISANWQLPSQSKESNTSLPLTAIEFNKVVKGIINDDSAFIKSINFFMQDLSKHFAKEADKLISIQPFDPEKHSILVNVGSPIVKTTFDLDDKEGNTNTEGKFVSYDKNTIGKTLAQYGVVFPGAESLEITKDSSDPLITVFTIKKTYF